MRDLNTAYQEAKSLPSTALHDEMRNGSGNIPEFIVMAELDSRAAMQGGGKRPKITVRDEMMMGLPPPQMKPQVPTNGFAHGGLIPYYNWAVPDLLNKQFSEPHNTAEIITASMNLAEFNQPNPQVPLGLQSLTDESGKTPLKELELPDEQKRLVKFASGGIVGGQIEYASEDLELLAKAIRYEAGTQTERGRRSVGYNVFNRMKSDKYPNTMKGVILQPKQYSAFNDRDPSEMRYKPEDLKTAEDVAYGRVENPIGDSLNYYNPALASPSWGPGMKNQIRIGDHVFGTASGGGPRRTNLPRSRPPQETTTGTEMVNLTSEPEDTELLTVLAQMAAAKRETLLPQRNLRMTRQDEDGYSDKERNELEMLLERYGGNV